MDFPKTESVDYDERIAVKATDKLKQRLDAIDAQLAQLRLEANAQANAFVVSAADHLGIEVGPEGWRYDRASNTFRRAEHSAAQNDKPTIHEVLEAAESA